MAAVLDTPIRTSAQNLDRVLGAKRPAVLVFEETGSDSCRALAPALDELARAYAGRALIVRVEDVEGGLAARYRITRVPTLVFWRDGAEVARVEGAAPPAAVRAHLEFLVGQGPRPAPASGPATALKGAPDKAAPRASPRATATAQPQPHAGAAPVHVTDATFEAEVLHAPALTVVDFWAPWCGPCRMVAPALEEFAREFAGRLRVAKVNTDEDQDWAVRLGVQGIPTLIFFRDGREIDRIVGAMPKSALKTRIEKVLNRGK